MFVLGLALCFGICMPKFIQQNPGVINTGMSRCMYLTKSAPSAPVVLQQKTVSSASVCVFWFSFLLYRVAFRSISFDMLTLNLGILQEYGNPSSNLIPQCES